jgi:GTP cyclohydrolase II
VLKLVVVDLGTRLILLAGDRGNYVRKTQQDASSFRELVAEQPLNDECRAPYLVAVHLETKARSSLGVRRCGCQEVLRMVSCWFDLLELHHDERRES